MLIYCGKRSGSRKERLSLLEHRVIVGVAHGSIGMRRFLNDVVRMEFKVPDNPPDVEFEFERLIAYQATVAFRDLVRPAFRATKRGTVELRDQLNRASLSMITNTAEGAGRFSPADKARFYLMASGSTTECVSLLGECETEGILDNLTVRKARFTAHSIVSILTKWINKLSSYGEARASAPR